MKRLLVFVLFLFVAYTLIGQTKYKLPPKEVVDILDEVSGLSS